MNAQPAAVPLRERVRAVRRRGRTIAAILGVGTAITLLLVLFLPPTYRATATILIEQQEIPQEVVRSTITSFADQRLQVISQRVMTSQNLLGIAERFNLYAWQRRTRPREVVVEKMRNDIKMKLVSANVLDPRSGRPTQATIAFTVSFDSGSPAVAVKVANELTSLYLNENLAERTRAAEQASTFLAEEGARLNEEIQQIAQKLADFKERHVDSLPELSGVNFQLLDRTEVELRDANSRIGTIDAQKAFIEAQLATMTPTSQIYTETGQRILSADDRLKTLRSELAGLRSKYAPDHPDVLRAEREVAGLQTQVSADNGANDLLRRLEEARGQLAGAQQKYSPEHPDVVRLQRVIAAIEDDLKSLPAVSRVKAARANPDNPAYIQLQAQLEALLAERAATVQKQETLRARLDDFQARLAKAPAVEKEYRKLASDYDNAQLKYREVRSKQMEAQVSQNLETERKGERFTLIEPPILPEDPVSPNRPLVLIGGLVASGALALLTMAMQEALDSSVRSARDLEGLVQIPPLVTVPVIETEEDAARQRRLGRRAWAGAAVSVLVAILSVHVFYRPLDLLWFAVLRRMGL
jgi:succinoglycan biosynthesis transport protein ExoP